MLAATTAALVALAATLTPIDTKTPALVEAAAAVAYVAHHADVPVEVITELVSRESDGRPHATRYCVEWQTKRRYRCKREASCYTDCHRRPEVWRNRLDVGMFQLRDAPTWSWRRWYNRTTGSDVAPECLVDPMCAATVMAEAVVYLKGRAARERWKCSTRRVDGLAWLSWWNGCGSYRKYVRALAEK